MQVEKQVFRKLSSPHGEYSKTSLSPRRERGRVRGRMCKSF